jgi:hypothetical protein
MTNDVAAAIFRELERVEESATHSASSQFALAQQYRAVDLVAGIPATALAATAGVTALASTTGRVAAGVIALVAAALSAIVAFLGAAHRSAQATAAGNEYLAIVGDARRARTIDMDMVDLHEARRLLRELTDRAHEQNKAAQPPNVLARWLGKRSIVRGDREHEVDAVRTGE